MATDKRRPQPTSPPGANIMAPEDRARNIERGNRWRTAELGEDGIWYYVTYIGAEVISSKPYQLENGFKVDASTTARPRGTHALKRRAEIEEEARRQKPRETPYWLTVDGLHHRRSTPL